MRAPPLSLRPITGAPTFIAMSMTLQIFCAWRSDSEPPNTVKSWLNTKTSRPLIVPDPVTTPSPGIFWSSMPKSVQLCSTYMSSSSNALAWASSSTLLRSRSRAVSRPLACCATAGGACWWSRRCASRAPPPSAELDRVSAADLLAYEEHASNNNWRLPGGYGTLVAGLAEKLPLALGTRVTAIDHHATRVRVETDQGPISAAAAIVAVPTDILARGDIAFAPGVGDHLHAAARLPLGRVDKLFLALGEPDAVPPETHLTGNPHTAETGSYYLRPFGRPVIECFFGGIIARRLEEEGDAARAAFAIRELGALLGADFARHLRPMIGTWWHKEPTIGGAYSHALPGAADQRAVLARPAGERLAFAGEACSPHDYSTVHGAWQSGIAAAEFVEASLR
jgi:hypothetical protein